MQAASALMSSNFARDPGFSMLSAVQSDLVLFFHGFYLKFSWNDRLIL